MAAPSLQDFISGFDPTGQNQIQGSDLLNIVQAGTPFTDKGLVINSTDIAGVPQVPNATVNPKWQNYLWKRTTAGTAITYQWNPNKAFDAVLLFWDALVTQSSLAQTGSGSGRILQILETIDVGGVAFNHGDSLVATLFNTPTTSGGKALAGLQTVITPISTLSTLLVECILPFSVGLPSLTNVTGSPLMAAALFTNLSANAVDSAWIGWGGVAAALTEAGQITLRSFIKPGSISPLTLSVRAGWIGTWNSLDNTIGAYNAYVAGNAMNTGILGTTSGRLKVTEYL